MKIKWRRASDCQIDTAQHITAQLLEWHERKQNRNVCSSTDRCCWIVSLAQRTDVGFRFWNHDDQSVSAI